MFDRPVVNARCEPGAQPEPALAPGKQTRAQPEVAGAANARGSTSLLSAPPPVTATGLATNERGHHHRAEPAHAADGGTSGPAAPTPIAVRNGPGHRPITLPGAAGMSIDVALTSSSGVDADMARIRDREVVAPSSNHTGCFADMPPVGSANTGFMSGYPIPPDQHTTPTALCIDRADNHGGNGSYDYAQLDLYLDAAAGVSGVRPIPHSGYIIRRQLIKGDGQLLTLRTEKHGAAVSADGYSSAAGPSPSQHDDVVIRR